MPRPNPASVTPGHERAHYVAIVTELLSELDAAAYRLLHDNALRHYRATSHDAALGHITRVYRTTAALLLVLDVLEQIASMPREIFFDRYGEGRNQYNHLGRLRLSREAKVRNVERLARLATHHPQSEAVWERAFVARQTAVAEIARQSEVTTSGLRRLLVAKPNLYGAQNHTGPVETLSNVWLGQLASVLGARALATVIWRGLFSPFEALRADTQRALDAEAARRTEDALIEADARAKGYL